MTPDEAATAIRMAAAELSRGEIGPAEMRSAFGSNLLDLCRDEPLSGDFLACFQALETLELAEGADLPVAVGSLKEVAQRLADEAAQGG